MSKLESFIAKSALEHISEKLGTRTIKHIEKRLYDKYGLTLEQGIKDFEKFDMTLREILGPTTDKIEKQVFSKILSRSRLSNEFSVLDSQLSHNLLESYGDPYKKIILETCHKTSFIINDIIKKTKIPQATVYRRISELIDDGLLVDDGFAFTSDNKKVLKYTTILENINIDIDNNSLTIFVKIKKEFMIGNFLAH